MTTMRRDVPREVLASGRLQEWDRLLADQAGMVHVAQLRRLGVTWSSLLAQVEAARWRAVVHGVYATFTGPLPRESRIWAALLYGGAAAILSHRTAAEEWHLTPVVDGPVHLTVPYGASAISQPGLVTVHRSRAHSHIVVGTVPPRTSRADTAVDVAVEEPDALSARTALLSLLTGGGVRPLEVERRLRERPPRRYRRALAAAVGMVRDGVHSVLEEVFAVQVEQAHGLPPAHRQSPFVVDGVTLWEDATYDHVGIPLTVRLDGRTHLRNDVSFRDRRRDNAAELAGRSRLTFGWTDLSADPCGGAEEVEQVLRRHGWTGRSTLCPACAGRRSLALDR
ncbi:hypothetical protein EV383_4904 [Pseudonocardia sediminis]|uniref:Transcriptional regulator, AbiEi antitoxin, Type IV TA system n=1 Tax=Pseudonocardia sediminis TaxID=1397368 RepID=A0A4V2FRB8_PSEST|nr:hypothetical protein [Pseudonocardia sediminis]RZT87970.1 hypothetical protein EV383_4904 [Pseudonocardia sediminis]